MSLLTIIMITTFAVFILLFVLILINAIHFYCSYYDRLSRQIDGRKLDVGFLFAANRFMLWGHYCLSRARAERAGVVKIFEALPNSARNQLIFHWFGVMLGLILMIALGGWVHFKNG